MKLAKKQEDEGQWVPFRLRDDGASKTCQLKIRRLPKSKESELQFRHYGRKLVWKNGRREIDREALDAYAIDKACYALLDSKDFPEIEADDAEVAELLSKAMGRAVAVGEKVKVDGTWSDELKRLLFDSYGDFAAFVNAKADAAAGLSDEDEEDLGKI